MEIMLDLHLMPRITRRLPPLLACLALAAMSPTAHGQFGRQRPSGPVSRARPPSAWPPAIADQFFSNAFDTLEGKRPDFAAMKPATGAASGSGVAPSTSAAGSGGGGWSAFVSGDTLVDEIKAMKGIVDKAIAKKGDFTRGGYKEARNGFSSIAAAFGVIAAYDGDVRWKQSAPRARDVFGRVAADCNQGNNETFTAASKAAEDLKALLDGATLEGAVAANVAWHRVAARPPLMWRLEEAEKGVAESIASEAAFKKSADRLAHEAEVIAMIGEFIRQPEFEFFEDDTYLGYAATMRDAAVQAAAAAKKGDYGAATSAVSGLRKACTDCHGDYR